MKIFISWYDGLLHEKAKALHDQLAEKYDVTCSPCNSHQEKADFNWNDWYKRDLPSVLEKSDVFIAAITKAYDGSSWMAQEYHEAFKRFSENRRPFMFYINYDDLDITAVLQKYYFENSIILPVEPVKSIEFIEKVFEK